MRKHILLLLSLGAVVVLSVGISSCGSDDPAPNPQVSFSDTDVTVDEGDGTVEIDVVLSSAASENIVVEYSLSGTATEGSSSSSDYSIDDSGELEIKKGQTKATIEIELNDDGAFEGSETIKITIDDVDDGIDIGNDNVAEIEINDNDTQATASFQETTMTAVEDDGRLEIEVKLDKPAGEDITVSYTLSGSAIDSLTAFDQEIPSDYYIDGVSGEVEIAEGETTGTINVQLYTDFEVEDAGAAAGLDPETIVITLTGGTGGVAIGTKDELTVSLKQQDGRIVLLDWADPATDSADMDLFYWFGEFGADPEDMGTIQAFWSITPSYSGPELVFIPDNLPQIFLDDTDASFGFSYTYWGGNRNSLGFQVTFIDITNGVVEGSGSRETFNATYTMANINEWDNQNEGSNPQIVQTFNKVGGAYSTPSQITVPGAGSRVRTSRNVIPMHTKRGKQKPIVF